MKVKIDGELCCGQARCRAVAPDVYELDETGYNKFRGHTIDVPPGQESAARRGARSCPDRAISIVEE